MDSGAASARRLSHDLGGGGVGRHGRHVYGMMRIHAIQNDAQFVRPPDVSSTK